MSALHQQFMPEIGGFHVTAACESAAPEWDAFVDAHPEGRFCQLWGYRRALERAYGMKSAYADIVADGERIGVFPSIVSHRARRLVSQPFNEYGGALLLGGGTDTRTLSDEVARELLALALRFGCHSVEIRGGLGCKCLGDSKLCSTQVLQSYGVLQLREPERLFSSSLNYEARKAVKRARGAKLRSEIRRGADAVAQPFYQLYLRQMKRLAAVPHAAKFFAALALELGERFVASWVFQGDTAVAVLLAGISGSRVHCVITASDERSWAHRPNDLAYWALIEWAARQGFRMMDFGSARLPSELHFKQKWGAELHQYTHLIIGEADVVAARTHSQHFRTMAKSIWRRYMPLPATAMLGPLIRKYIAY